MFLNTLLVPVETEWMRQRDFEFCNPYYAITGGLLLLCLSFHALFSVDVYGFYVVRWFFWGEGGFYTVGRGNGGVVSCGFYLAP